jgi:hypothetical protein
MVHQSISAHACQIRGINPSNRTSCAPGLATISAPVAEPLVGVDGFHYHVAQGTNPGPLNNGHKALCYKSDLDCESQARAMDTIVNEPLQATCGRALLNSPARAGRRVCPVREAPDSANVTELVTISKS